MPPRRKPVAKCRYLFNLPSGVRGWGQVDHEQQPDYDDGVWQPDPTFQEISTRTSMRQRVGQPSSAAPPIPQAGTRRQRFQPSRRRGVPELTVFIIWTLEDLEYVTLQECKDIWPLSKAEIIGRGKVKVNLTKQEEIAQVLMLRSALGLYVKVKECKDYFSGITSTVSLEGKLRHEAQWLPWYQPLRTWAVLTSEQRSFDPWSDVERWFPPPSFHVACQTPTGNEILNYVHISKAFTQGIQAAFKSWEPNPTSPDLVLVLEINETNDLTLLLEVQPCCVLPSPYSTPFQPIHHIAIGHAVLTAAKIESEDIRIVNCRCSMLDITEAIVQHETLDSHITVCDAGPSYVADAVRRAKQWSEAQNVNGVICPTESLPFRDNSVDVVIGYLYADRNDHARQKLSRQLQQMARICCLSTGRVCFLTNQEDIVDMILVLGAPWASQKKITTSFRSFTSTLYILNRSAIPHTCSETVSAVSRFRTRANRGGRPSRSGVLPDSHSQNVNAALPFRWPAATHPDPYDPQHDDYNEMHDDDMDWARDI